MWCDLRPKTGNIPVARLTNIFKVFAKKVLTETTQCGTLSRQRGRTEATPKQASRRLARSEVPDGQHDF